MSDFDVNAARQSGASDDEILSYLSQRAPSFDLQGALKQSSKQDVISYLATHAGPPTNVQPDFSQNPPGVPRPTVDMQMSPFGRGYQGPGASDNPGSFEGHPENIGQYIPSSVGEVAGGAKDIAQGNIARGGHRIISGVGAASLPVLPFLGPLIASNPGTAARVVAGGALGGFAGKKGAEVLGANPDQANLAGDIGGMIGGYGATRLPGMSPSALKSGASSAFDAVSNAAGSNAVDVSSAADPALDALELKDVGRTMPRVMQRFLQRVSDPNAAPLSYDEARNFYSAAGELSANDQAAITPAMKRLLKSFKSQLGDAISQTAENAGMGGEYAQAMTDYAKAKRLEDSWEFVWDAAKKNLVPGLIKGLGLGAGGAAGYGLYKSWSQR